jgi:hypothetical protein
MNISNELKKLYYNASEGFISADKLLRKAILKGMNVNKKQIDEFLKKQYTYQVTKQQHKPKEFSSIISPSVLNNIQIDLMIYDRFEIHKYKYILMIVDVYSRYVTAIPLTTRKFPIIMSKIKETFNKWGIPKNINCDNEFNTHEFNEYAITNDITVFFSQPDEINKNAIVERVNRTIAGLLNKYRIATKNYDWPKYLNDIVYNYNHTYHSTIKETPADVFEKKESNKQDYHKVESDIKVGDKVRIKRKKKIFDKGDLISLSDDLYLIDNIDKNRYYLKNIKTDKINKTYYKSYELQLDYGTEHYHENVESNQEIEHEKKTFDRKITKQINKEGIERNDDVSVRTTRSQGNPIKSLVEVKPIAKPTDKKPTKKVEKFVIEDIIGKKYINRVPYYEVKWVGYPDTTLEPAKNIKLDLPDLVRRFEGMKVPK